MDTIFIEQLAVETIIGVNQEERLNKQTIYLDIELQYDSKQAIFSDNIKHALDYHQLSLDIHAFVAQSQYELIEALAHAIADEILENKNIKNLKLTLYKPQALDLAQNVGIKIHRLNP